MDVRRKLNTNAILAGILDYDEAFTRAKRTIEAQVAQIYLSAYKSVVPIKADFSVKQNKANPSILITNRDKYQASLNRTNKLTPEQSTRVGKMIQQGRTLDEIIKTLIISPGSSYGGALRDKHISLTGRAGTNLQVIVDDYPHVVPYTVNSPIASQLAADLNEGRVFKKNRSRKRSSAIPSIKYATFYRRSRPSQAEPGFTPEFGFTTNWISKGHQQADAIVQAYLASRTFASAFTGPLTTLKQLSKTKFRDEQSTPQFREFLRGIESKGSLATKQAEVEQRRDFFSGAIANYYLKQVRNATNKGNSYPEIKGGGISKALTPAIDKFFSSYEYTTALKIRLGPLKGKGTTAADLFGKGA